MFGWLRAKPPLPASEKAWTETHLQRLVDHLGVDQLVRTEVVLPTREFLAQLAAFQQDRVQLAQMIRDRAPVGILRIVPPCDAQLAQVAGPSCGSCDHDESHTGTTSGVDDVQATVAQVVQDLSHAALVHGRFSALRDADLRMSADLTAIFAGYGLFSANTSTIRRSLPARMWGYALALFAWVREEPRAEWTTYLHPDPKLHFQAGLRFLQGRGESLFGAESLRSRLATPPLAQVVEQLQRGSASTRIAALWDLAARRSAAESALPHVLECAHARDPELRAEGLRTLGALGTLTPEVLEHLGDGLHDPQEKARAAAAFSLGQLHAQSEDIIHDLAEAVQDDSALVSIQAAEALGHIGPAAQAALPSLLQKLRSALVACNDQRAMQLTKAIQAMVPDVRSCILEFLADSDQDLRHVAVDVLQQMSIEPAAQVDPV